MIKNTLFKNLVFSISVFIIIFLIAEVISVALFVVFKMGAKELPGSPTSEKPYFLENATLGWIPAPGYDDTREVNGEKVHFRVNSASMRDDREILVEKSKNSTRIFCLGDSITEGLHVANSKTYPKVLEAILNKNYPTKEFEVFNCGVTDYSTRQEVLYLRDVGLKFKPDIVILGYYLNDGRGFVPSKTIKINSSVLKFYEKSRFFFYINKIFLKYRLKYQWRKWNRGRGRWVELHKKQTWRYNKDDLYKLIGLADREWGAAWTERGWKEVARNLDLLKHLQLKNGFKLIILNFPVTVQIYSDFNNDAYLYKPQEQIKQYCLNNNTPYIDFIPYLKKYPQDDIFVDYCHYTAEGLGLIAEIVYQQLKAQQIIQR